MDNAESFKNRLRVAIGNQTVRKFADNAGVSEGLVRKYLSGASTPGLEKLVAVAEAADVSIEWLATGNSPMRKTEEEARGVIETVTLPAEQVDVMRENIDLYRNLVKRMADEITELREELGQYEANSPSGETGDD